MGRRTFAKFIHFFRNKDISHGSGRTDDGVVVDHSIISTLTPQITLFYYIFVTSLRYKLFINFICAVIDYYQAMSLYGPCWQYREWVFLFHSLFVATPTT